MATRVGYVRLVSELELLPVPHKAWRRASRPTRWTPYRRGLWAGVFAGLAVTGLFCALELLGLGGDASFLAFLSLVLALALVVLVGLVALCFSASRGFAISVLIATLLAAPTFLATSRLRWVARSLAFDRLASRSESLVSAIHTYEARHAIPLQNLLLLVPEFLTEVPGTGMPSYPDYIYTLREPTPENPRSWSLRVECPSGFPNWDEFIYLPPQERCSFGPVTRHGDWVYFHE